MEQHVCGSPADTAEQRREQRQDEQPPGRGTHGLNNIVLRYFCATRADRCRFPEVTRHPDRAALLPALVRGASGEGGHHTAQHQLLLAVRGSDSASGPTIGEIADALLLRHHSAVELIDRAEAAGLVHRFQDEDDHRVVRLALTREGDRTLAGLASAHLEELARLGPRMSRLWRGLTER
ncbi:MAG: MarR family winged helix-turn-helix transcriptional regulator [Actinomycetota bacterium]